MSVEAYFCTRGLDGGRVYLMMFLWRLVTLVCVSCSFLSAARNFYGNEISAFWHQEDCFQVKDSDKILHLGAEGAPDEHYSAGSIWVSTSKVTGLSCMNYLPEHPKPHPSGAQERFCYEFYFFCDTGGYFPKILYDVRGVLRKWISSETRSLQNFAGAELCQDIIARIKILCSTLPVD